MSYIGSKPANKPVVGSDLDPTIITGQTAIGATPADTDELIISDAGVLKRMDYSHIKGGGKVLQVVHAEITSEPSLSATTTYADIAGLNVTITPAATSSKILVTFDAGIVANSSVTTCFILERAISGGATTVHGGHTSSSRPPAWVRAASISDGNHDYGVHATYLDSPSTTSAITYTVQWTSQGTAYLNRSTSYTDTTDVHAALTNSRVYAMEIGA